MDDLSQIIQTVIVILIVGSFIAFLCLELFYKGRKKQIIVIKKRITEHQGLNTNRSKITSVPHFTVDCKYPHSDKIKTFGCQSDIYNELKKGKKYVIIVKLNQIIRICREKV